MFISAFVASLFSITAGLAQTFTAGEIVTTLDFGKAIEVKVIKQDASGVLVLLKDWQDQTFKTGGSSRYYLPAELTRPGTAVVVPVAGGDGPVGAGAIQQANPQGQAAVGNADLGGTGPLSKQQVIDYLSARVGTDGPHPRKEAVSAAVVEAIKKRGVNFKSSWKDMPDFSKAGADTTVTYAIGDNYGAPAQMPWLLGPWELQFTNATSFYASRDSAAKMGFVSIEPAHTYIWKVHQDDPAKVWIDGKWREATPAEMKYQGGAGIVLLNGEQQWDWIVHKDMTASPGADWINVADMDTRQVKRGGKRKLD